MYFRSFTDNRDLLVMIKQRHVTIYLICPFLPLVAHWMQQILHGGEDRKTRNSFLLVQGRKIVYYCPQIWPLIGLFWYFSVNSCFILQK